MGETLIRQGVDRLATAVAVLDGEGVVRYANDAWTGVDAAGTVPVRAAVGDRLPPACDGLDDDHTGMSVRDQVEALLAGEAEQTTVEYTVPGGEGSQRWFRMHGRSTGADGGVVLEHTERTEQRRAAVERDHYRGTLADVATVVSHDLRSPLSAARSWAELLETGPEVDTDRVTRMISALDRLNTMADDAVTLARETAVKECRPVELGQVARETWTHLDEHRSRLIVEDIEPVLADEDTAALLFEHLLRNAVEHGSTGDQTPDDAGDREAGGRVGGGTDDTSTEPGVTVRVGPLADGFYVADDGPGIPEALGEELFEPGITTSDATDNTGLGLAIVERAADAHGWTVELVGSEAGGARFEVTGVARPA